MSPDIVAVNIENQDLVGVKSGEIPKFINGEWKRSSAGNILETNDVFGKDGKLKDGIFQQNVSIVSADQVVPVDRTYNVEIEGKPEVAADILLKIDKATGVNANYKVETQWYDGTLLTDDKVDGIVFKKIDGIYYKRQFTAFDIRDFGIVNDPTLDQSKNLDALCLYCDYNNIYEIDFLGYSLMTSKTKFNVRPDMAFSGLTFRKLHKIKNLNISHDKSVQLTSYQNLINFFPVLNSQNYTLGCGKGTWEFENVTFDAYVQNYKLTTTSWDGACTGFLAYYGQGNTLATNFQTGIDFKFSKIKFLSPAISYNMCLSMMANNVDVDDVSGEYWGLYILGNQNTFRAKNMHGIFRDDLHTPSGRVLVTNLIHQETEIANPPTRLFQDLYDLRDVTCYNTKGELYSIFKFEAMYRNTIKNLYFENCKGNAAMYCGAGESQPGYAIFENVKFVNCRDIFFSPSIQINNLEFLNSDVSYNGIINTRACNYKNIKATNSTVYCFASSYEKTNLSVDSIELNNCSLKAKYPDDISFHGLINKNDVVVNSIKINGLSVYAVKFLNCIFSDVQIQNLVYMLPDKIIDFLVYYGTATANISITGSNMNMVTTQWTNFIAAQAPGKINLQLYYSYLANKADIDTSTVTITKDIGSVVIPSVSNTAAVAAGANPTKDEFDKVVNDLTDLKTKMKLAGLLKS